MAFQDSTSLIVNILVAIGTVGATAVALVVAISAQRRQRRQETNERIENERAQALRERAQADLVTAWLEAGPVGGRPHSFIVSNASSNAIYDVVLSYGTTYGAGTGYSLGDGSSNAKFSIVDVLPPGTWKICAPSEYPGGGMGIKLALGITFRDAASMNWLREAGGSLSRIDEHPFVYSRLSQPFSNWAEKSRIPV